MDRNEAKAAASIQEFTAIAYYIGLYSKLQAIVQHYLIPGPSQGDKAMVRRS